MRCTTLYICVVQHIVHLGSKPPELPEAGEFSRIFVLKFLQTSFNSAVLAMIVSVCLSVTFQYH